MRAAIQVGGCALPGLSPCMIRRCPVSNKSNREGAHSLTEFGPSSAHSALRSLSVTTVLELCTPRIYSPNAGGSFPHALGWGGKAG